MNLTTDAIDTATPESCSDDPVVHATLVAECDRMNFLPFYFGTRLMMTGEQAIYDAMQQLCPEYIGAFWNFYELSNGGFYMSPQLPGPLACAVASNDWNGQLSADAAGVVATSFALNRLIWAGHGEQLEEAFYKLNDFIGGHPEAALMRAALD